MCDYQAEVVSFSYLSSFEIERTGGTFAVQMDSLNVGFGTSGVDSIDSKASIVWLRNRSDPPLCTDVLSYSHATISLRKFPVCLQSIALRARRARAL